MPVFPTLGRLGQEDDELQVRLGCTVRQSFKKKKKSKTVTEEMSQQLQTLTALAEDSCLVFHTHMVPYSYR